MNTKSGQEVAKSQFSKTDARHWQEAIFKQDYVYKGKKREVRDYAVRIQWQDRRELFNLKTSNKAAAAAKARDIYTVLVGAGWTETLAKFKPESQPKLVATIGDLLAELRGHWAGRAKTFDDYCRSFRSIVSQIFEIKAGNEKFDYVNGGRKAWLGKIDRVKLSDVTPDKVNKWRIAFVAKAGASPVAQRRARISCNSMMRQAKSLFSAKLLEHVTMQKPDKLPFDGVPFYKGESMRYRSTIDIRTLIRQAQTELPQEQLKIFFLATMAGLTRNEIDKLEWRAFDGAKGHIRIETTDHFAPKSVHRLDDVPIEQQVVAFFRGCRARATGRFVIEGQEPQSGTTYTQYRADEHFEPLLEWLRAKDVIAEKPLHELRKEFGSQICKKGGIYSASRTLRHADIGITARHYLDQKARVTVGLGNLIRKPRNVTPIPTAKGAIKAPRSVTVAHE